MPPRDFVEQFSEHRPMRIVIVGQLLPRKNVAGSVEYLGEHFPPDRFLDLRIIGTGPTGVELAKRVSRLPRNLRVSLRGYCEPEELLHEYHWADALLFPTLHDDWGLVVNEAFASGLPVLGSDAAGAVLELVSEGVHGFVFKAGDARQMTEAISRFYDLKASERRAMSTCCRQAASQLTSQGLASALLSMVR